MDWNWFFHDPKQWIILIAPITPFLIILIGVLTTTHNIRRDIGLEKKYKRKLMKEDKKRLKEEKKNRSTLPEHLQEYYRALDHKDNDGMLEALEKNAASCPSRNSYCLTEVFCPECPLANGGLSVQSCRKDW